MNWIMTTFVGAASGVLASMGMGGGFILVVYFALFTDIAQKGAQGINLMFFIPITVVAVWLHIKNKLIDVKTALICSAIGLPVAAAGFFVAQNIGNGLLRKAFAVFIILSGLKDLLSKGENKKEKQDTDGQ